MTCCTERAVPDKYLIYAAIAAALLGYIGWSQMEMRALRAGVTAADALRVSETARADQNVAAVNALTAAQNHNNALAEEVAGQRATINVLVRQTQERIASAPASDDAPLAPVMLDALDGLRRIYDAAHRDPLPDGADPA